MKPFKLAGLGVALLADFASSVSLLSSLLLAVAAAGLVMMGKGA